MLRHWALFCGIVMVFGIGSAVFAGPRGEGPCPCPNGCVPNVATFGHYQTTWRVWPGEVRLDQINPRAVGTEVLPTPTGQEELPLPRAQTPLQPAVPHRSAPAVVPPPSPSTVLPPESTPLPLEKFSMPPPTEPIPANPLKSPISSNSPALPARTAPSTTAVPKAVESPIQNSLPGLPVEVKPSTIPAPKSMEKPLEPAAPSKPQASKDSLPPPKISLIVSEALPDDALVCKSRASLIGEVTPTASGAVEGVAFVSDDSSKLQALKEVEISAAAPAVALNGYCVVELAGSGRWVPGDIRWTAVHKGWIYRLSGPEQLKRFQDNPDLFAPANAGNDPVLTVDEHRAVAGQPAHCAMYQNRLYMFSSVATQAKFNQNPRRYALGN